MTLHYYSIVVQMQSVRIENLLQRPMFHCRTRKNANAFC